MANQEPNPSFSNELELSPEEAEALGLSRALHEEDQQPSAAPPSGELRLQGEVVDDEMRLAEMMRMKQAETRKHFEVDTKALADAIPLPERKVPRAVLGDAAALFDAARKGRPEDVRRLLQNGVDPGLTDDPGNEHAEAIRFLCQNEDVGQTHVDGMKLGRTACHMASARGRIEVLGVLIEAGADVNVVDHAAKTPLMLAAFGGYHAAFRLLLQSGARVDLRDWRGGSALLTAARGGHLAIVQDLLNANADPNVTDQTGCTPVLAAAQGVHGQVLWALIQAGADVTHRDLTDLDALTSLVTAVEASEGGIRAVAEERLLPLVKLLLQAGAKSTPDANGTTPVSLAQERGYNQIAALLEKHG